MIDKFVPTIAEAMAGIQDGATVLAAGFGPGTPSTLMKGLAEQGARDLTIVMNAGGRDDGPIAELLSTGHVRKLICSFVRADSVAVVMANDRSVHSLGERAPSVSLPPSGISRRQP